MIRAIALLLMATPAFADPVLIEEVRAIQRGDVWRFDVTVMHPDTGWDHYADTWEVFDADGNVLGTRILAHPHVNEQPFTRSLSGVMIPDGMREVFVRARCSVDGWNSEIYTVELPKQRSNCRYWRSRLT